MRGMAEHCQIRPLQGYLNSVFTPILILKLPLIRRLPWHLYLLGCAKHMVLSCMAYLFVTLVPSAETSDLRNPLIWTLQRSPIQITQVTLADSTWVCFRLTLTRPWPAAELCWSVVSKAHWQDRLEKSDLTQPAQKPSQQWTSAWADEKLVPLVLFNVV